MLLSELKENGLKGELVDFVWVYFTLLCAQGGPGDKLNVVRYVDEVQDLLLTDTRRTPCDMPFPERCPKITCSDHIVVPEPGRSLVGW
jgi:hypothetical protein